MYGQKEKMLIRMREDPTISRQTAIVLPRMSFYLDGLTYDANRKQVSVNKIFYPASNNSINFQYVPVPWNLHFSLYVYVKNAEDGTKIIEQILPFFTPDFTVKAFMIPNQPSADVNISLINVSHENTDTTEFKDNSVLIWTLQFTIRGLLYGPVRSSPLITNVTTTFYTGNLGSSSNTVNIYSFGISNNLYDPNVIANSFSYETISAIPGLTANGQPTNQANQSVGVENISALQDWGIILNIGGL